MLPADTADSFASYFNEKVETHSRNTTVKDTVYNGKCKLIVQNRNFMKSDDVKNCLSDLSSKKY